MPTKLLLQRKLAVLQGPRELHLDFQVEEIQGDRPVAQSVRLSSQEDAEFLYSSLVPADRWASIRAENSRASSFKTFSSFFESLLDACGKKQLQVCIWSTDFSNGEIQIVLTEVQTASIVSRPVFQLKFQKDSQDKLLDHLKESCCVAKKENDVLRNENTELRNTLEVKNEMIRKMEETKMAQTQELKTIKELLHSSQSIQRHYENLINTMSNMNGLRSLTPTEPGLHSNSGGKDHRTSPLSRSGAEVSPPPSRQGGSKPSAEHGGIDLGPFGLLTHMESDSQPVLRKRKRSSDSGSSEFIMIGGIKEESGESESGGKGEEGRRIESPNSSEPRPEDTDWAGVASYIKCLICDETTTQDQDGMSSHMTSHVSDSAKCGHCRDQPSFDAKEQLLWHMISAHAMRLYECRYCGKPGRLHYLKIHVRSHTGGTGAIMALKGSKEIPPPPPPNYAYNMYFQLFGI